MKKNQTIIAAIVGIIVVGGLAFYGGTMYQKNKAPAGFSIRTGQGGQVLANLSADQRQQLQNATGQERQRLLQQFGVGRGMRPGNADGQVIAKDDKSITVKLSDGSTKTVYYSDSTTVTKSSKATSGDLATNSTVTVNGTPNQDGSVTAQSIQITTSP